MNFNKAESTAMGVAQPIDFAALFGRVAPLEVDLGSGHGTFLLEMAAKFPGHLPCAITLHVA